VKEDLVMTKVSIIIPIFNADNYLDCCMKSVINQTLSDIEIICINDGSTDLSYKILEKYKKQDVRINIINKINEGYGKAINDGIDIAHGEYIGIVEPDDYIALDMMETLYDIAQKYNLEVVKSDFAEVYGNDEKEMNFKKIIQDVSYYHKVITPSKIDVLFRGYVMNPSGIYQRSFLIDKRIRNNETPGAAFQDQGFWFQIMLNAERLMLTDYVFYYYRQDNPNSSIASKEKVYCICDEFDFIYNILKKSYKYKDMIFKFICCRYSNYLETFNRIDKKYRYDFLKRMQQDFIKLKISGDLDTSFMTNQEKQTLLQILENPYMYYERSNQLSSMLSIELASFSDIIIYGVGLIGKKIYNELDMESRKKVVCFAVTDEKNNVDIYSGIKVININKLISLKDQAAVIVATTSKYREEIQELLKELSFKYVIVLSDEIM
jgi:glycosyltransferase involved in cell wall biosynthesis